MRAVWLRIRGTLRHRWPSVVVLTAIVALASGTVLALIAGARRTAGAPAAFAAAAGGEIDATVSQPPGVPRTDEVAALPSVRSADATTFAFGVVPNERDGAPESLVLVGRQTSKTILVAGRDPDPTDPYEIVADERFVADHDAELGDRFTITSWTAAQIDRGGFGIDPPEGPTFDVELVGVFKASDAWESDYGSATLSPAAFEADPPITLTNGGELVTGDTFMAVRLEPGSTVDDLRSQLDALPGGTNFTVEADAVVSRETRTAVDALGRGVWLMALVTAVATVIALGQVLTRHVRLSPAERMPLAAMGVTGRQMVLDMVVRGAIPALAGVALGALAAVLASGWFPAGFVRQLAPDAGLHVDMSALIGGGGALVVGMLTWVAVAVARTRRVARRDTSPAREVLARRVPSVPAAVGVRFAHSGQARSGASVVGAFVTLVVIATFLLGTVAFASSLDRLVTEPARFGSNFTAGIGAEAGLSPDQLRTTLAGDADIEGLMILTGGRARTRSATVDVIGVEHVLGDLAPRVLSGRLPDGPDEVALGQVTARQLDVGVGGELELAGDDAGDPGRYRVVGTAVVPTLAGAEGVGVGGVMTAQGFAALVRRPDATVAAVRLRTGAPAGTVERLAGLVGQSAAGLEDPPAAIVNVGRIRAIPIALAALLTGLTVVTALHTLVVSLTGRQRDLAILRALGADGPWVGRALHWQATMLIGTPLLLGIPLGLLAGAVVFRAFVGRIGAVPDPSHPVAWILAIVAALLLLANLAAIGPAWRARRPPPARLLQAE